MLKLIVALVAVVIIWRIGVFMLRALATPPPEPPPPGELRKVNRRYRCSVCGMELQVRQAQEEDPPPPRHCMEEMEPVAQVE